ncbi:MAG: glucose-6-phosphate dehydrogenase [Thermoanaerobacteraceae bacterium]
MVINNISNIMVIFGGTGDLTHRKLMPAIYNLKYQNMLPDNFAIVSIGRRDKTEDEYRKEVFESIKNYSRFDIDNEIWDNLSKRIYYKKFDFADESGYKNLNTVLNEIDEKYNTNGNRIYYLAVSPEYFGVIVEKLRKHCMAESGNSWHRVVIEKPFGEDLKSAQKLNKIITDAFTEKNIYRIDHYLGKEMLQNIMVIRFANVFFEPVWDRRYIDNVQISSNEIVGIENRGSYYEKAGALRDMVQNHMLQLLTLTAMEPPVNLNTESIRDEKVKVLKSIEMFTPEIVEKNVVRGQYIGYKEEEHVSFDSNTETFVALKLHIENFRWAGVPFYIRTGKKMPEKSTEIIVQFKPLPGVLYFKEYGNLMPNLLIIRIQPEEGVNLQFNAKVPGAGNLVIQPVDMDFCQNCQITNNSPEAYERLIFDVMKGDSTLFTRWDEVLYSWNIVDSISDAWENQKTSLYYYKQGTWGPEEANLLLTRENRKWWNV